MLKENLPSSPMILFDRWYKEACLHVSIIEPNAMSLATVNANSIPSVRTVLMKKYYDDRMVFFTNYNSKKASDISDNNSVAVSFFWNYLEKQVRITGSAYKLSVKDSDQYFASRSYMSKIGAWASNQSQVMGDRMEFSDRIKKYKDKFKGCEVGRPNFWGGYYINIDSIEFWHGMQDRLHYRYKYLKSCIDNEWDLQELYP